MLTVPPGPRSAVYLFEQVRWKGNVWIGEDSQSTIFTFHGLQDDDGVYYLGWVKIVPESTNGFPVTLPSELRPEASVTCFGNGSSYLDFYSNDLDYCRYLEQSGFYSKVLEFGYCGYAGITKTKLICDPCLVCCGKHRGACPLTTEPPVNINGAKKYFDQSGYNVVRKDLAEKVIKFVGDNHFLLVSFVRTYSD